ncbi:hypothetical protein [Bacillus sp. AG4(2022)]|uniref:hypothetical protein n=1 Tax=Bacillus sp. AG4(2022) TaxID=2962594 RepID=UPI002882CB3D|nr:hypothetical protein [Bacillus sp. AG4(2022)]MDT0160347.1 hypothetical protein [Bacillus sp. AG4(2022)]
MNLEWTFADTEGEWVNESFETKEEAVAAGKLKFDDSYLVGQLIGNDEEITYSVVNIEEVS